VGDLARIIISNVRARAAGGCGRSRAHECRAKQRAMAVG